jgi:predicted HAD superfamily Cof-like phosphohydrolase
MRRRFEVNYQHTNNKPKFRRKEHRPQSAAVVFKKERIHMSTNFEKVVEFNEAVEVLRAKANLPPVTLDTQMTLIREEVKEVESAFNESFLINNAADLAKELADLLYVVYGMFYHLDIDADMVYTLVHNNNMSKISGDARFRADGKLLKPDSYRSLTATQIEAVMMPVVKEN